MPIRINLLAEQQAIEEMRRKDPVKLGCWIAGFLVALMLIWSLALQLKSWSASEDLKSVQMRLKTLEKDSVLVITNQTRTSEMNKKLAALHQMSTNRLLCASVLNAIQFAIPENTRLVRVRTKQDYEESPMIPILKLLLRTRPACVSTAGRRRRISMTPGKRF